MRLYELDLNWATRDNAQYKPNYDSSSFELLNCNIRDVLSNMESDFALDPDDELGGKNHIGDRVPRAKAHWQAGQPMDYPSAGYSKYHNSIYIDNGRHRTVAAYQLGKEYIPMFVSTDGIDKFKEIVRTK